MLYTVLSTAPPAGCLAVRYESRESGLVRLINKWVKRSTLVMRASRLRDEQEDLDTGVNTKWEILYRTFERPYFLAWTFHQSGEGAAIDVV